MEAHQRLAAEAAAARESGGLDVMAFGDSIMEAFRGQSLGMPAGEAYAGNRAAWDKAMEGRKAGVFALAGDQAVHLLWRLAEGEGPEGLNPKVITLMICTNDLAHLTHVYPGSDARVGHIISLAVQQVVAELRLQAPQATLVVFALLPLQPMMLGSAQRQFDGVLAAANREIWAFVEGQASRDLRFKDCGPRFLTTDGSVNFELMPDGVHPAGPGGEALLQCMLEEVDPLLG
ncbi:SGNH hydrolase [Micractinium conductrix]|uniref:SGNH hydrolase n=1 Tax=Micractinium conductrix TaxID=554055 RepID=A0A2P6V9F0_9CHLO|nr:SGNH hydrolase [Micractinium conductrix]|eukprot:PSC70716.1 SGNH hydrolase [Micractinium conductrix]